MATLTFQTTCPSSLWNTSCVRSLFMFSGSGNKTIHITLAFLLFLQTIAPTYRSVRLIKNQRQCLTPPHARVKLHRCRSGFNSEVSRGRVDAPLSHTVTAAEGTGNILQEILSAPRFDAFLRNCQEEGRFLDSGLLHNNKWKLWKRIMNLWTILWTD